MNDSGTCVICQYETKRMACDRCEAKMRRQLDDLPRLMEQASANLIPGQGGDGRSTERTLGINVAALDVAAGFDAIAVLESWERIWREDYGLSQYGLATATLPDDRAATLLRHLVAFLGSWLAKSCTEHPAIDDFAAELRQVHRSSQQAAGQTRRTAWRVTCPADTDDGECGTVLIVSGEDFDGSITCRGCRTTWPTERLLRVVASSKDSELWLDAEAASRWLGVNTRTLRRWAAEGVIRRSGGRYDLHSLKALVTA